MDRGFKKVWEGRTVIYVKSVDRPWLPSPLYGINENHAVGL